MNESEIEEVVTRTYGPLEDSDLWVKINNMADHAKSSIALKAENKELKERRDRAERKFKTYSKKFLHQHDETIKAQAERDELYALIEGRVLIPEALFNQVLYWCENEVEETRDLIKRELLKEEKKTATQATKIKQKHHGVSGS